MQVAKESGFDHLQVSVERSNESKKWSDNMDILSGISRLLKIASFSLNSARWLNIIKGILAFAAVMATAWTAVQFAAEYKNEKHA